MNLTSPPAVVRQSADLKAIAKSINSRIEAAEKQTKATHDAVRKNAEEYRAIGAELLAAKRAVRHGQWMAWVKENLRCDHRQVNRWIRLAKFDVTSNLEELWQAINGNTPEEPEEEIPLDAEGHEIPAELIPVFADLEKFKALDSLAVQLQKGIDELAKSPGGEQLARWTQATGDAGKVTHRIEELNVLKRHLRGTRPYSVCPHCAGGGPKDCKGCSGSGWVSEVTWKSIDERIKARLA